MTLHTRITHIRRRNSHVPVQKHCSLGGAGTHTDRQFLTVLKKAWKKDVGRHTTTRRDRRQPTFNVLGVMLGVRILTGYRPKSLSNSNLNFGVQRSHHTRAFSARHTPRATRQRDMDLHAHAYHPTPRRAHKHHLPSTTRFSITIDGRPLWQRRGPLAT